MNARHIQRFARHTALTTLLSIVFAPMLTACSMMSDDRSDCPTCYNPLRVALSYDYNMHGELFSSQVQQATVYVVDPANGRIVDQQTAANTATAKPLKSPGFTFNFEGLQQGSYRLYATGLSPVASNGSGTLKSLSTGDDITTLSYSLPSDDMDIELDTVWNTLTPVDITLEPYTSAEATVPLMRLTKDLSIVLIQTEQPSGLSADDYDVTITTANTPLDYNNTPADEAHTTVYSPYARWTTTAEAGAEEAATPLAHTAHYDLSFPRLISHDDATRNARLVITHKADKKKVLDIDLVYYLAMARNASARNYSVQEFLDREHDYHLDIVLSGNQWKYMTLSISVLSWSLHIQNEDI